MSSMQHRIAFFHANGYPPGVYRVFFQGLREALGTHGEIVAAPFLPTPENCKPTFRWPHMLGVAQQHASASEANVLIGHSMGGYLALQTAAANPAAYPRVILIDSPIPRRWRSVVLTFSQLTGFAYKFGPAPVANARKDRWLDRNGARAHFASKAFIQRWAEGVLDDFIAHAIVDDEQGATLAIPRASERDIYANIVHAPALAALRKARTAGVKVTFIAGGVSEELRLAGREGNRELFAPNFIELDNIGHLIPLEAPTLCAATIRTALV